jgi:hypothetical protein
MNSSSSHCHHFQCRHFDWTESISARPWSPLLPLLPLHESSSPSPTRTTCGRMRRRYKLVKEATRNESLRVTRMCAVFSSLFSPLPCSSRRHVAQHHRIQTPRLQSFVHARHRARSIVSPIDTSGAASAGSLPPYLSGSSNMNR